MMKICMIAAVAENGIIGQHNQLPWDIKSEWQYFVRITRHKPIIMGRKTFESLGAPLKDRANIIISRDPSYKSDGITVTATLDEAIGIARKIAAESGHDEIMIGGGAEIYKLALPLADRLYITEIHCKPEGDTKFPDFDRSSWVETKREFHKARAGETADYTVTVLDRKEGQGG